MQQFSRQNLPILRYPGIFMAGLVFISLGCAPKPSASNVTVETQKPFAGVTLTITCQNSEITQALTPVAKSWSTKTGAGVNFTTTGTGDINILPTPRFAEGCAKGEFSTLTKAVRQAVHPLQINGQIDAYYEGLAGWQGQPHGVVLATDAAVLIFRKDRFDDASTKAAFKTRLSRDLTPPSHWDDFLEIAEFFSKADGKPSLPAFPKDADRQLDLFHRIAACTDRPSLTQANMHGRTLNDIAADAFSFHFDFKTGQPRLNSPGFALALDFLRKMAPYRGSGDGDPIAGIETGSAVMAVATMADLARLKKGPDNAVPATLGIARLPGSKTYYDALSRSTESIRSNESNFIPYLGGGWIGAVPKTTKHLDAAMDLLGHLGGPEGAAAIISRPAIGSGPWRADLLDANKKNIWYGYGLNATQTQDLMTALRPYVASDLRNPAVAPRGPGIESLMKTLAPLIAEAANGPTPAVAALKKAQDAWTLIESTSASPEQTLAWRRGDMRAK